MPGIIDNYEEDVKVARRYGGNLPGIILPEESARQREAVFSTALKDFPKNPETAPVKIPSSMNKIIMDQSQETISNILRATGAIDMEVGLAPDISKAGISGVKKAVVSTPTPTVSPLTEFTGQYSVGPITGGDEAARTNLMRDIDRFRTGIISEATPREYNVSLPGGGSYTEKEGVSNLKRAEYERDLSDLEEQRIAGIIPLTGMAEYESNISKMKLEGQPKSIQKEIISSQGEVAKEYLKGISGLREAGIKAGAAENIEAQKGRVEAVKLGLQAENIKSNIQYRMAQMQDMAVKTGYLEPMKLQLAQAKTNQDRIKIQRDFYAKMLNDIYQGEIKSAQDATAIAPGDAAAQGRLTQLSDEYASNMQALMIRYPMLGDEAQTSNGQKVRFDGTKWIKVNEIISTR